MAAVLSNSKFCKEQEVQSKFEDKQINTLPTRNLIDTP